MLLKGEIDGGSLAVSFFHSPEFLSRNLSDSDFLSTVYWVMRNQTIDASGVETWGGALSDGCSRDYVLSGCFNSAEFVSMCSSAGLVHRPYYSTQARDQNRDYTKFVNHLYRNMLGRNADEPGLNSFTKSLLDSKGDSVENVAYSIYKSQEFANRNKTDSSFISALYQAFLNRAPSSSDLQSWMGQIAQFGRDDIFYGLIQSTEAHIFIGTMVSSFHHSEEGIDVSQYQGLINWPAVAASGKKFAMIRALGNGVSVDPFFYQNVRGAKNAGLKVGVYYYTYAINEAEVRGEIEIVRNAMALLEKEGYRFDYPIAVDIESNKYVNKLSTADRTHLVNYACTILYQLGYYPVVYTFTNYAINSLYMNQLASYDLWLADYRGYMGHPAHMWQYSSKGSVSGISGSCDLNISYKDYGTIIRTGKYNHFM